MGHSCRANSRRLLVAGLLLGRSLLCPHLTMLVLTGWSLPDAGPSLAAGLSLIRVAHVRGTDRALSRGSQAGDPWDRRSGGPRPYGYIHTAAAANANSVHGYMPPPAGPRRGRERESERGEVGRGRAWEERAGEREDARPIRIVGCKNLRMSSLSLSSQ